MVDITADPVSQRSIVPEFQSMLRTQAELVDQPFNCSEGRLARILLIMAEFGKPGEPAGRLQV